MKRWCPFCRWDVVRLGADQWWCESCEMEFETAAVYPAPRSWLGRLVRRIRLWWLCRRHRMSRADLEAHAAALDAQIRSLQRSIGEAADG